MCTETLVTMQDRAPNELTADEAKRLLLEQIEQAWPASSWRDVGVAVAVSGGPDSVALLRLLAEAKKLAGGRGELVVLHYDHGTRGDQSAADSAWVRQFAESLGFVHFSETSPASGARSEEAFRDERRAFYRRAADRFGARYLATGHTADDQAETVLFRLLRGSGLRGAAAIRPFAPLTEACTLARPLLGVPRADLLAYLAATGQAYREDATNADNVFARNWLRLEVLPLLESRFPTCRAELAQFATRTAEAVKLLESMAAETLEDAADGDEVDAGVALRVEKLAALPAGLVPEVVRLAWRRAGWPEQAMTAEHWRRLAAMATKPGGEETQVFPGAIAARRGRGLLLLAEQAPPPKETGSC